MAKRIIPAHAGNTQSLLSHDQGLKDHPRSCGEYLEWNELMIYIKGSSPLMRGIRQHSLIVGWSLGIIPAHAGNTRPKMAGLLAHQDHPRSCGEYFGKIGEAVDRVGSSPLMRGILFSSASARPYSRIIPAHAGNTKISHCKQPLVQDHPRSCGEYNSNEQPVELQPGSSPLMRGIHPHINILNPSA